MRLYTAAVVSAPTAPICVAVQPSPSCNARTIRSSTVNVASAARTVDRSLSALRHRLGMLEVADRSIDLARARRFGALILRACGHIAGTIDRDSIQPRRERRFGSKRSPVAPRAFEDVLHQIVGIGR